jgi:hypothetical protein
LLGPLVGSLVGPPVGLREGRFVGPLVGILDGLRDGTLVEKLFGFGLGFLEGSGVSFSDGWRVSASKIAGYLVGTRDGYSVGVNQPEYCAIGDLLGGNVVSPSASCSVAFLKWMNAVPVPAYSRGINGLDEKSSSVPE